MTPEDGHVTPAADQPAPERPFGDPTRRTYLAQERTLLAWWRTGLTTVAVAIAVGRLLPELAKLPRGPYLGLGVAYGVLAVTFVVIGSTRNAHNDRAIADNRYARLDQRLVLAVTIYMVLLAAASVWAMFWTA